MCILLQETLKKLLLGVPLFSVIDPVTAPAALVLQGYKPEVGIFLSFREFCTATEHESHLQCKINSISCVFSGFMEELLPCFWMSYIFVLGFVTCLVP